MICRWVGGPIDGHALTYPDGPTVPIEGEGRHIDLPVRIRAHDGQRVLLWSEVVQMIGTSKP